MQKNFDGYYIRLGGSFGTLIKISEADHEKLLNLVDHGFEEMHDDDETGVNHFRQTIQLELVDEKLSKKLGKLGSKETDSRAEKD